MPDFVGAGAVREHEHPSRRGCPKTKRPPDEGRPGRADWGDCQLELPM